MASQKPSEIEIVEVFAYNLFLNSSTQGRATEAWQQDPELRQSWRKQASDIILANEMSGISCRVSSTPKVKKTLREMMIQPEQQAYSLQDGDSSE